MARVVQLKKSEKGVALLFWSFILSAITLGGITAVVQREQATLKRTENIIEDEQLTYLAEKGIHYAFIELKNNGFNWFTHYKQPNGNLHKVPDNYIDKATNPVIDGAAIDSNGDYLPLGNADDSIRVRIYKTSDSDSIRWIVSKATITRPDGTTKAKIVRASINADSLYNYFRFINGDWYPGCSSHTYDCQGFGKIYVNGDIIFNGSATIKDPALLSTNSNGIIKVQIWHKTAPWGFDDADLYTCHLAPLDGYAFLTKGGAEPIPRTGYPSEEITERYGYFDNPFAIFSNPPEAYAVAKFKFTNGTEDESDDIVLRPPKFVKTESSADANYTENMYYDDSHDNIGAVASYHSGQEEVPVKFIRLYYHDTDDDTWHITANPHIDEERTDVDQVVAQVFDGIDTAAGDSALGIPSTPQITIKYCWGANSSSAVREKTLNVVENIPYQFYDVDGNPQSVTFNPDYERAYWGASYNDPRQYALYGYYRGDDSANSNYGSVHWDEYKEVNYLNTSYTEHAQAFKKWVNGEYTWDSEHPEYNNDVNNNGKNLWGIIRERNTGARDLTMVEIENTYSRDAKENGIWIGYEGVDKEKRLTVYVGGAIKYQEGSEDYADMPDWLNTESFITGVDPSDKSSLPTIRHADTVTIDIEKLGNDVNMQNSTNGVIWINYNPTEGAHYSNRAIKIINGETIPREEGITIATPNPVFIQGDLNYQEGAEEDSQDWKPTSIISDSSIYLLSKNADLPAYDPNAPYTNAPAYSNPHIPCNLLNYVIEHAEGKYPNPDHIWPEPGDNIITQQHKLEIINEIIKEYYNNRTDRAYCEPASDFDARNLPSLKGNEYLTDPAAYLRNYITESFNKAHRPINHPDGQGVKKPAMPLVDSGDRDIHIYAALITPDGYGYSNTVENLGWGADENGNGAIDGHYNLTLKGMFPNVKGANSSHWSDFYTSSCHCFCGNRHGGNRTYTEIAENYSESGYPPGNLTLTSFETWYITNDTSFFSEHK